MPLNTFTAQACKKNKNIWPKKCTHTPAGSIFSRSCNEITFSSARFDGSSFTCNAKKKTQMLQDLKFAVRFHEVTSWHGSGRVNVTSCKSPCSHSKQPCPTTRTPQTTSEPLQSLRLSVRDNDKSLAQRLYVRPSGTVSVDACADSVY